MCSKLEVLQHIWELGEDNLTKEEVNINLFLSTDNLEFFTSYVFEKNEANETHYEIRVWAKVSNKRGDKETNCCQLPTIQAGPPARGGKKGPYSSNR